MKRRLGVVGGLSALICGSAVLTAGAGTAVVAGPAMLPTISDFQFISGGLTPPSQSDCNAAPAGGRRCFSPASMAASYNYSGLHADGVDGRGTTIAIVDSFGSDTIASDLNNFNTQFGLPHMCGEPGVTCTSGMPTFKTLEVQGSPPATPPPSSSGTGQENHNLWALEVSLDVEWSHATAPMANILLVTSPTAETLGVQGFAQFMNAEQYVVDNHLADVISQSFASAEGAFSSFASLDKLRHAFISAAANHVTVLGSSGDGGTANPVKEPVKNPALIPYPSVEWPASDPLVTGVGGTYLCTDATTGASVDSTSPPPNCQANPGVREIGWIAGGGGYSIFFPKPSFQDTLPPGSTYVGSSAGAPGPNSNMRGVPDVSYQASSHTGVLVYMTESATTRAAGTGCGAENPCDPGWYIVGGTSSGSPQWAGIVAMADQWSHSLGNGDVGYINPALYQVAGNPTDYANDFYDVTVGNNQADPSIPGYTASTGWDAVTGLGTPNVANLIPDLVAAAT
jgi:subtilase family serine protease